MKILQLNTRDIGGGAEKIAWNLFEGHRSGGNHSWMAVGEKISHDADVLEIPPRYQVGTVYSRVLMKARHALRALDRNMQPFGCWIGGVLYWLAHPLERYWISRGFENFEFPGTWQLLDLLVDKPDLIHAHNLHGGYFDLRYLVELSHQVPVLLTLHDEWTFTGHCAYTLGCKRWEQGCGSCPDLTIYPEIKRDATEYNWTRKREIYRQSRLYLSTPSDWLMERAKRSMLKLLKTRVIPNGIDVDLFKSPENRQLVREQLELPPDAIVFLAVVQKWSCFKDYQTIEDALVFLSKRALAKRRDVFFVNLGCDRDVESSIAGIPSKKISYITDPKKVAAYYQAADVFLHAAHSENFPTTVLESLACGTPVIATAVGGIPEQIEEGETGFLVPQRDAEAMSKRMSALIQDDALRERMGKNAVMAARRHFSLNRMLDQYQDWYDKIIADWQKDNKR